MVKQRLSQYLSYTKKERNGILLLLLLIILLLVFRTVVLKKSDQKISTINSELLAELERFEESLLLKEINKKESSIKKTSDLDWTIPEILFNFDPNTINDKELKKLGFSEKQINTLLNYREKGGKFFTKTDLLKIYGISKKHYDILESYIQIVLPEKEFNKPSREIEKLKSITLLEINSASETELTQLTGVGVSFAKRICKYRDILGGFYEKEQLMEIYGMDSTRYNQFLNQFFIDTSFITKVDLNSAKYEELIKRQYLSKYQVQAIIKYREIKGAFSKIEELLENNLVSEDVYIKVRPYLVIK